MESRNIFWLFNVASIFSSPTKSQSSVQLSKLIKFPQCFCKALFAYSEPKCAKKPPIFYLLLLQVNLP